jgi:hypothetical protein
MVARGRNVVVVTDGRAEMETAAAADGVIAIGLLGRLLGS